jgi:hypothetical protein
MRYLIVTIADSFDGDGTLIPAGTVINEILWDGISPYTPPPNTRLVGVPN